MEIVLSHMLPESMKGSNLANLSQEELQEKLNTPIGPKYGMTYESKLLLDELVKERVSGKYMDDKDGFEQAFKDLYSNLEYDETKSNETTLLDALTGSGGESIAQQVADDLYEDRDVIRNELATQLRSKVNKHLTLTKRKETDFIRPKASETTTYGLQKLSVDNSIENLKAEKDEMESQEDFDKEAYARLKQELTERRQAKERLLSQGLP